MGSGIRGCPLTFWLFYDIVKEQRVIVLINN